SSATAAPSIVAAASATIAPSAGVAPPTVPASASAAPFDAPALLAALGGRGNISSLETAAGRLLIRTALPKSVDETALARLGIRGIAHVAAGSLQLLVVGPAEGWAEPLRALL